LATFSKRERPIRLLKVQSRHSPEGSSQGRIGRDPGLEAEEEGFCFPRYEEGTRWYVLGCYTRDLEAKGFTISRTNTG